MHTVHRSQAHIKIQCNESKAVHSFKIQSQSNAATCSILHSQKQLTRCTNCIKWNRCNIQFSRFWYFYAAAHLFKMLFYSIECVVTLLLGTVSHRDVTEISICAAACLQAIKCLIAQSTRKLLLTLMRWFSLWQFSMHSIVFSK